MNRTPLLLAALMPLVATAGAGGSLQSKIDVQKLQEDVRVTEVIGADVTTQGGQESGGTVEDVILASDGRIEAVLVDGMNEEQNQQPQDQPIGATEGGSAGGGSGSQQQAGSVGTQTEEGLTKIQWDKVNYDPQQQTVTVASGGQSQQGMSGSMSGGDTRISGTSSSQSQAQQGSMAGGDTFRANEIVGMEVHLSDAESFGEVEDVLIDPRQGKATALLVDAWEGFDKQTYALPVELDSVNREDNTLKYQYTESDVIALQEYEEQ